MIINVLGCALSVDYFLNLCTMAIPNN